MEQVLTCLRPHSLCWTFVLGVARLSRCPTGLLLVVALRMSGGVLLFPYLWSHVLGLSLLFGLLSLSLVSSCPLSSALLRQYAL